MLSSSLSLRRSALPALSCLSQLSQLSTLRSTQQQINENLREVVKTIRGTVLDVMAKSMPEQDRKWLAERWGFLMQGNTQVAAAAVTDEESKAQTHPILGDMLRDLGYKKVYATSVAALVTVPIWEKQRTLRAERARNIADDWTKRKTIIIPGLITLHRNSYTGDLGIIDGQHRVGALMLMAQEGHWPMHEKTVLIDVFDTESYKDVCDLFVDINSAQPVKLIDMPGEGADPFTRSIIDEASDILRKRHPDMFKPSQRCRVPHVNIDSLRDEIFQSGLLERHDIKTPTQLVELLDKLNEELRTSNAEYWQANPKAHWRTFNKVLDKAHTHRFYLGLDKTWHHK